LHAMILVGYYSGAYISTLDSPFDPPKANQEFQILWDWLTRSSHLMPEQKWDKHARGGHLSLRLFSAESCSRVLASIHVWINQTGRIGWRAFSSGHSIDVLDNETSKVNVAKQFALTYGLDLPTQVLCIGDCGQEGGNDFELLSEGFSLSCDAVSSSLTTCWNFGALGNKQSEVTALYLRALVPVGGAFKLSQSELPFLQTAMAP
jgi:hypothetical protein